MSQDDRAETLSALVSIAQKEGIGALYAGVWLTWVKQAPQYAVTFLCYDLAKAWLAAENGNGKHGEPMQAQAQPVAMLAQPGAAQAQRGPLAAPRTEAPFSLPAQR